MRSPRTALAVLSAAVLICLTGCAGGTPPEARPDPTQDTARQTDGSTTSSPNGVVKCRDVMPREKAFPDDRGDVGANGLHPTAIFMPLEPIGPNDTPHLVDPSTIAFAVDVGGDNAPTFRDGTAIQQGDVTIWRHVSMFGNEGECEVLDDSPKVGFAGVTDMAVMWEITSDKISPERTAGADSGGNEIKIVVNSKAARASAYTDIDRLTLETWAALALQCARKGEVGVKDCR